MRKTGIQERLAPGGAGGARWARGGADSPPAFPWRRYPSINPLADPILFPLHVAFFFVFGTLWGSFFNVCIYRLPAGLSVSMPGSHCLHCGAAVRWFDNLPVLSYWLLGGRCRNCAAPFSMRYALVELLTGGLFLALFLQYGFSWALPAYFAFTGLLLIATFTDIDHWIILDRVSLGGALAGLAIQLAWPFLPGQPPEAASTWLTAVSGPAPASAWWGPAANGLAGALAGAGFLWGVGALGSLIFRKPAMGLGDVKLLLLIGMFAGWKLALLTIFVASFFGSIYGLGALLLPRILSGKRGAAADDPVRNYEQVQALLDDGSPAASGRGWLFSDAEKNALARVLAQPSRTAGGAKHHLPFGPHLALAGYLLVLFGREVLEYLREYLDAIGSIGY